VNAVWGKYLDSFQEVISELRRSATGTAGQKRPQTCNTKSSKWNLHWSARAESHDDGPSVLAMLNGPAVA
jgi:hypothetical protein